MPPTVKKKANEIFSHQNCGTTRMDISCGCSPKRSSGNSIFDASAVATERCPRSPHIPMTEYLHSIIWQPDLLECLKILWHKNLLAQLRRLLSLTSQLATLDCFRQPENYRFAVGWLMPCGYSSHSKSNGRFSPNLLRPHYDRIITLGYRKKYV